MQKKKGPQILFTNDSYVESTVQRGNRTRSNRLPVQNSRKIRTFDFVYNFNDYLKLTLAKILPKYTKITFIPDKNTIIGEQQICQELIVKTHKQFTSHKFIILYNKKTNNINQLDFWIDAEVNIYRPQVIEIGLQLLEKMKMDCFSSNIEGVRESMKKQGMFLMRIPKNKEIEIRQQMATIIEENQKKSQMESVNLNSELQEDLTFIQQDNSFTETDNIYMSPQHLPKKQTNVQPDDSCSLDLNSIIESSIAISQKDHIQTSNIYTSSKKKKQTVEINKMTESFERVLPFNID